MFFTRKNVDTKDIVLEAVFKKVPLKVFRDITMAPQIDTVEDLHEILDEPTYNQVCKCIREEFAHQTIWYLVVFRIIMGLDKQDCDYEEFNVDL